MTMNGYNNKKSKNKTIYSRFKACRDMYKIHTLAALAVLATLLLIFAQVNPVVQQFIIDYGLIQYITLIVLLDLAAAIFIHQRPAKTRLVRNQDETMEKLIEAVGHCRSDSTDLLEYAGATTLPLIRAIRREGVPMRMLVKHPEKITGTQRQRNIATLDTLYNSIFDNYNGSFEIRCYRLPYTLRARRLGKELLELGWLTPDIKHETAYGHGNPSVLADLSTKSNNYLLDFFNRTFEDLWEDSGTEDGLAVLNRLIPSSLPSNKSQ